MTGAVVARALPVTARGQRTRQAILDAAEAVFGEEGYHQAGIAEITRRANVALGTFYVYFPDKKAAFDALIRELNHSLRAEIRANATDLDDRIEIERAGFETFFRFVRQHRNLYKLIRQAESVDEALYRWHYETLARGYVRGLRAARAGGQIRADLDPETVAYCLMSMAEGMGMRWVLWEGKLPTPTARKTLDALLRATLLPR